jgi:hypothetical protein
MIWRFVHCTIPKGIKMPDQSIGTAEVRIEKLASELAVLRRQVQSWKRGAVIFTFAIVGLFFLAGAAVSRNSFLSDSFVLNDPVTKQRLIDMVTMNSGAAGFQVGDRKGTRRILLGTNHESQPGLTLWDSKGRQRILVGINNEDIPHITIWDTKDQHRITIGLDDQNNTQIIKLDANGNAIQ